MNTPILFLSLLGFTLFGKDTVPEKEEISIQSLEEILHQAEAKILLVDLNGNVYADYPMGKFLTNQLSLTEMNKIDEADFMISFNGDHYYLIN